MDTIELSHLWTAAAVVAGFQLAAFSWRLNRELNMEMLGFKTWLTVADILVVASFLLLVAGVFAAPVLGTLPVDTAARLFGLAFEGFSTSPIILTVGIHGFRGPHPQGSAAMAKGHGPPCQVQTESEMAASTSPPGTMRRANLPALGN